MSHKRVVLKVTTTVITTTHLLSLLLFILYHITLNHAKDLNHARLRSLSPEHLLKEYSEMRLPANTSYAALESTIVSWTGARIPTGMMAEKSKKRLLTTAFQHSQEQQQQHMSGSTNRRKTKSGLLIESSNFHQDFMLPNFAENANIAASASTLMSATATTTTRTVTKSSNKSNRRGKLHQQQEKQHRRNRNGRNGGHRQKLHRNALRLLNSPLDSLSQDVVSTADGSQSDTGLFPPLFNVAPRAKISVNATCGQNGREEYCKLVDAYPHKKWATQCGICNAQSSDASKQRPIESVLGNTGYEERWWQSPTLQYGRHYEYVTITLDLQQIYQVFFVMLKSANSPRPASWVLEKSLDGYNWQPWQYFGLSDADCRRRYNLAGQNGKYVFQSDTEVICTTQFYKALPLENGELHVSLLKNRPGAMEQSAELLDFITARYLRIRLQGMHSTANLDNSVDWLLDAQSLEKRSFYSLKQIRISARLECHGHAEKTVELAEKSESMLADADFSTPLASQLQCVCQHNTCGPDCGECCGSYQARGFRNGTARDANACELCHCYGHAESCIYDAFLERGICQECRNNTAGNECEFCAAGFYRPLDAAPTAPCERCRCNELGSEGHCKPVGGICHCREGFQGLQCDECAVGYFGDECRKCPCDSRGSIHDPDCAGECKCKANVQGETCAECHVGFYDLSAENPEGCAPCWCSGVGLSCSSAQLQTLAFETLNDWRVTDITRSQLATPTVDAETKFLVYGMYDLSEVEAIYWQAPQGYLGNHLTSYGSLLAIQVSWVVIRGDTSGKPTSGPNVILFGRNGMKIAYGDEEYARMAGTTIELLLQESGWYHVPAAVRDIKTRQRRTEYHGDPVTRGQFLSVLAHIDTILIRGAYHTDQVETVLERVTLYSGGTELAGKSSTLVEQCVCPTGYTGLSCEGCDFGYIRSFENSTNHQLVGKCIPCPCNGHSNSCNLESGGCGDCMHNTYGDRCERCRVGFYGNPMQGTPNDCKRCACPLLADSNNFSPSCQLKTFSMLDINNFGVVENFDYVCTQCPPGYTGDHCEMCDDGYYGNPIELNSKCLPCDCDGGPCDVFTGKCITCNGNTEGWHCERCKMGYWGDPSMGCEPCDCYAEGADSGVCDSTDGQCLCKPRFAGQKCDECEVGYANIDLHCLPCNCDLWGAEDDDCDPYTGQCNCKHGVIGLQCDECADEHFGLKEESGGCTGK